MAWFLFFLAKMTNSHHKIPGHYLSTLGRLFLEKITLNICFTVLIFQLLTWTTSGHTEKESIKISSNLIPLLYNGPCELYSIVLFLLAKCVQCFLKSFYFGKFRGFFYVFFNITWVPWPPCFKFQLPLSCRYSTMNFIMYAFNYALFYSLRWYYQVSIAYQIIVHS